MSEQLSIDGGSIPWEEAAPKKQAAKNKAARSRAKREENDAFVFDYLKRFDTPLSVDELAARLEPVGLPAATVKATMGRLRKAHIITPAGEPDDLCPQYNALGNLRYIIRETN